jgi:hypothetical protein
VNIESTLERLGHTALCVQRTTSPAGMLPWMYRIGLPLRWAASMANSNEASGVNLARWRETPVWRDEPGCVGNLSKSFSGTLDKPVIGEAGRRFLAVLLQQLSDAQLHDLFQAARVNCACASRARAVWVPFD